MDQWNGTVISLPFFHQKVGSNAQEVKDKGKLTDARRKIEVGSPTHEDSPDRFCRSKWSGSKSLREKAKLNHLVSSAYKLR